MSLSYSNLAFDKISKRALQHVDIAFGSSYPYGGESVSENQIGLQEIDAMFIPAVQGYSFEYDKANKKIKVFQPAPAIQHQERQSVDASNQVTLDYPCSLVMNVVSGSTHYPMIDYADTVASGEVQYTALPTEGVKSTLQFHSALTDELSAQGAFTGAATGWTLNTGFAYSANTVLHNATGTGVLSHDSFVAIAGRRYRVTYTISAWTVGTVTPSIGGGTGTAVAANGTYTEYFDADTTAGISFTPSSTARFTIDTVTVEDVTVYVTYITQAWKEIWDNIIRETLTTTTHVASSEYVYIAVESLYGNHASAVVSKFEYLRGGDAAATGECEIDFTDSGNSYLTTMTFASGDAITGTTVRAIKIPTAGFLKTRFIEDEDVMLSSGDGSSAYPVLFHATCGQIPDYDDTNERDPHNLQMLQKDALGTAGEFYIGYHFLTTNTGSQVTTNDTTSDAVSLSYVWGNIGEIQTIPLEVKNGSDLSQITGLKALVIGY